MSLQINLIKVWVIFHRAVCGPPTSSVSLAPIDSMPSSCCTEPVGAAGFRYFLYVRIACFGSVIW